MKPATKFYQTDSDFTLRKKHKKFPALMGRSRWIKKNGVNRKFKKNCVELEILFVNLNTLPM